MSGWTAFAAAMFTITGEELLHLSTPSADLVSDFIRVIGLACVRKPPYSRPDRLNCGGRPKVRGVSLLPKHPRHKALKGSGGNAHRVEAGFRGFCVWRFQDSIPENGEKRRPGGPESGQFAVSGPFSILSVPRSHKCHKALRSGEMRKRKRGWKSVDFQSLIFAEWLRHGELNPGSEKISRRRLHA